MARPDKPRSTGDAAAGENALLAAVWAAPEEDGPRLVYADFLQERGDPRGLFITLQCQPKLDAGRKQQVRKLRRKYGLKWLGPLAPAILVDQPLGFERGFLASCTVCVLWGRGPDDLSDPRERAARELSEHPAWSTLREVQMDRLGQRTRAPLIAHLERLGVRVTFTADLPNTAAAHADRARALLKRKDFDGALAAAREAITLDPQHPNAQHLAGWVLLSRPDRSASDLEAAIGYFREACRLGPADPLALVHSCNALTAAARADEAVALMEAALTDAALAPQANNWLGWYFAFEPVEPDVSRAMTHLHAATQGRPWWHLPWKNIGVLRDRAGVLDQAYVAYQIALTCSDVEDRKDLGLRCRELETELRRAGKEVPIVMRAATGELLDGDFVVAERACREGRFDDAIAAIKRLQAADRANLVDALGITERGANSAHLKGYFQQARELLALAVLGYEILASWSSSGAEGMGRMEDVKRVRRLLAGLSEYPPRR